MRDIRVENVGFLVGAAGRAALSAGCAAVTSAAGGDDNPSFGFCDSREVDESVALGRGLGLGSACDGVRERAIIAHGPLKARGRFFQHSQRSYGCLLAMRVNVAQSDLGTIASIDSISPRCT
jgi:hypothetical protein